MREQTRASERMRASESLLHLAKRTPNITREFLAQVRMQRLRTGLSLRALGARLGISVSTLARLERGEGLPNPHTTHRLWYWLFPEPNPPPCLCAKCAGPPLPKLGWECPRCHCCYAPTVLECRHCSQCATRPSVPDDVLKGALP
jgi:DNA-binding transcriptional regulator YiaG